ncbi:MAG: prepilin peptidase [archaeon]|jgi:preflagellin peptidase FlaK
MIETTFFYGSIIISLLGLIIATYTDLKERIVTNKLNYGLAIVGLLLYGVQSILQTNPTPFLLSILGLVFGFGFGWVLWKIGVFAGGDVKLFMGLGALNPFTPALLTTAPFIAAKIPFFPIELFLYSLIAFLPYGVAVLVYKLAKNKNFQKELYAEMKPMVLSAIHACLFASAAYVFLSQIAFAYFLIIITLFIWGALKDKKKYITLIALISATIVNFTLLTQAIIASALISVFLYSLLKLLLSTRKLLSKEIAVKNLTEGMIPAVTLVWKGKKVVEVKPLGLKDIINAIKTQNTSMLLDSLSPKKEIISSRKARGFTDEELRIIKKLSKNGLIGKKMLIKDSMPFVPTMFLGYLLCLIIGDAVLLLLLGGI